MKLTRRDFSKFAGAGVLAAAAPSVFSPAIAQNTPLKIGIIAPRSGVAVALLCNLEGVSNPLLDLAREVAATLLR